MLTGPLLISRFRNGKVFPKKLTPDGQHLKTATTLIECFKEAENLRRFELEEEVKNQDIGRTNPKIVQGLTKILTNRCEFLHSGTDQPMETREQVFSSSANYWTTYSGPGLTPEQHRSSMLTSQGHHDEEILNNPEAWLFGDVLSNQRLVRFTPIPPEKLIHRYNIEQVQGLLLNTINLKLKINQCVNSAFRQVMQMMKFFRLMFTVTDYQNGCLFMQIDGPGSVLENPRSYGLEIAQFFPAILLMKQPWHITAQIKVSGRSRIFDLEISNDDHYQTHYRETGVWANEKITRLVERFNTKYTDECHATTDAAVIPLSRNRYLLPDFMVQYKSHHEKIHVEWIRYLSPDKITFLKQIRSELPKNYLIAVKGKRNKLEDLSDTLGQHLHIFSSELTAPSLHKSIGDLIGRSD